MSFFAPGNPPINSTTFGVTTDPSTTALLAELDSSNFKSTGAARQYGVNVWLGGSSLATWILEQVTSTTIAASANVVDRHIFFTQSGQTSQFARKFTVSGADRIRVRVLVAPTGDFHAKLQAEELC